MSLFPVHITVMNVNGDLPANTFIGGVGDTITNAVQLAAKLSISESNITNFSTDANNNIRCLIDANYNILSSAFSNNSSLTYWEDPEDKLRRLQSSALNNTSNLVAIDFNSVIGTFFALTISESDLVFMNIPNLATISGNFSMRNNTLAKWVILSGVTNVSTSIGGLSGYSSIERLDLRSVTNWNATDWNNSNELLWNINTGCTIYVNSVYDGATLPNALDYAVNTRSCSLVYVDNNTAPSAITNLTASNIETDTFDVVFTAPSSTNTIDFYEVWLEPYNLGEYDKDRVFRRYTPYVEISSSGATITGLDEGVTYKVYIIACDEYYNRSAISNEIVVTTDINAFTDDGTWIDADLWND